MCQRKKEVWNLVLQDAEAAISIDSHLMKVLLSLSEFVTGFYETTQLVSFELKCSHKLNLWLLQAHYLMGLGLRHTQRLQESIQHLKQVSMVVRQRHNCFTLSQWL